MALLGVRTRQLTAEKQQQQKSVAGTAARQDKCHLKTAMPQKSIARISRMPVAGCIEGQHCLDAHIHGRDIGGHRDIAIMLIIPVAGHIEGQHCLDAHIHVRDIGSAQIMMPRIATTFRVSPRCCHSRSCQYPK